MNAKTKNGGGKGGPQSRLFLAVNGTLMRGLELNPNLLQADAVFVREAFTAPCYRLWSINDRYPAMIRVQAGGAAIALEIWEIPALGLISVLLNEPPGLTLGTILLSAGDQVLGILGESILCENHPEITAFGGWRAYVSSKMVSAGTSA